MYLVLEIEVKSGVDFENFRKKVNSFVFKNEDCIPVGEKGSNDLHWEKNTDINFTLRGWSGWWEDEDVEYLNSLDEVISFEGEWEDGYEQWWVVVGDKDGVREPCADMSRWQWWIGYKGNDIDDYYQWFFGSMDVVFSEDDLDEDEDIDEYEDNGWFEEKRQIEEWLKTNEPGSLNEKSVFIEEETVTV